ncbi:GNAT family N-acetyltransferase [Nostoc sp. FACHB-152]|uniref:GNAT family N-acetyltransferase n=1 Tax=unclassified Nostoc TaxID=2593658 RepID=UPI001688E458|nr:MULTISPECIES: GNAT family N-acetyltransferase [unclassified Nostoc]MBD2450354.1 GNAT family N-acetyltransferase [Nostoc sp. FACHB-152]MBD2472131.1 GNAT family N-acetyltransferase [Nostoc sp. FACHB-145]
MLKILQVETDKHKSHVQDLFLEYSNWTNLVFSQELNISFDVNAFLDQYMAQLHEFMPPEGRLLLAQYKGKIVGCACLRQIGEGVGEIKRMYVKSEFRQKGIGRSLLENLIYEAANIGYSTLLLDTAPFAQEAQALYRSLGFQDTEPYLEKIEIPPEYRENWVFMELKL